MKRMIVGIALLLSVFAVFSGIAQAGEVDILVDKLVNKGILTRLEADDVLDETKKQVAADIAKAKSELSPTWAKKIKIKGDLRTRFQYERQETNTDARERGRIRYRLGLESKLSDDLKVGAGLASGGDDPRSTNQTFEDTFETGDIRLDYAYAEYEPLENVKLVGGKFLFKDYLWTPTDLLWDGDINPYGGSIHAEHSLMDDVDGFLNTGVWVIDEHNKTDRPGRFLNYVQGGLEVKSDNVDAKVAATYYGFHGVKGTCPDWTAGTNTGVATIATAGACTGALVHDYDSVGASTEFGIAQLFGGLPLDIDERIAVFGDFIHNVDPSDNANGWAAGVKFGNKKIARNKWQAKWLYAYLGKDAWLDALPDSDRYGGRTDTKGHEVALEYGLTDNVTLGLDYYRSERIVAANNPEHLVQGDIVFKF